VKLSEIKTIGLMGKIIAEYCQVMKPRVFEPRAAEQKYIRELVQLEDTLKQQRTQLKLQLSCTQSLGIKKEFTQTIKLLDKRLKELETSIKSTIAENPQWDKLIELLISIKGFGLLSAYRFLAYLPDISLFKSAKQLAAFIGVSPKQKESGKYAGKTKLSKLGNPRIRNILYMPALNAKRFNEALQPFVSRLQKNGLAPKAIVGAVMRKLVHIIFGMIKNNTPFNPNLV
jgi:transposase